MNTQRSLMWKPYCMWCVSMNVCVPFSLWWMCNEVAEASIQQFSIYELLTLERRDLNITPSWNNSTSLGPSPAPLSAVLPHKASHAKQMVWPVIQTEEEAGSINVLVESASHSFTVFGLLDTGVHFIELCGKCDKIFSIYQNHSNLLRQQQKCYCFLSFSVKPLWWTG